MGGKPSRVEYPTLLDNGTAGMTRSLAADSVEGENSGQKWSGDWSTMRTPAASALDQSTKKENFSLDSSDKDELVVPGPYQQVGSTTCFFITDACDIVSHSQGW